MTYIVAKTKLRSQELISNLVFYCFISYWNILKVKLLHGITSIAHMAINHKFFEYNSFNSSI